MIEQTNVVCLIVKNVAISKFHEHILIIESNMNEFLYCLLQLRHTESECNTLQNVKMPL